MYLLGQERLPGKEGVECLRMLVPFEVLLRQSPQSLLSTTWAVSSSALDRTSVRNEWEKEKKEEGENKNRGETKGREKMRRVWVLELPRSYCSGARILEPFISVLSINLYFFLR